jgi:hypothetical protein
VGRFGSRERDAALRYDLVPYWQGNTLKYKLGVRFVGWDGTKDAFVQWSNEYVR